MSCTIRHVVLVLSALASSLAETCLAEGQDSTPPPPGVRFALDLRGVQLDGTIFFFNYAYSGSVDVDLLEIRTDKRSSVGIRGGVERFSNAGPGGETGGGPHVDYNLLSRLTVAGEVLRFDVFLGYARHTGEHPEFYPPQNLVKYGAELRWKIAPNTFGLLLKANRTEPDVVVGIGLYFGWDQ